MSSRLNALLKPKGTFGEYEWSINTWSQQKEGATAVRMSVFVREQLVPTDRELDAYDVQSVHILVTNSAGEAVGTARLIKSEKSESHIGRVAVLFPYRGENIGQLMMIELMRYARRRRDLTISLHAQTAVVGFYKKLGFEVIGAPFMEEDIPHVKMVADLTNNEFIRAKS